MTVPDGDVLAWNGRDGLEWRLERLGPGALRMEAHADPSAPLSARLAAIRAQAWAHRPPGLLDMVIGYKTLTVEVRPGTSTAAAARRLAAATQLGHEGTTEAAPAPIAGPATGAPAEGWAPRSLTIPVAYGGDAADVAELVVRLGLPWPEIIALHVAGRYRVAFLGFTPGFPYLHGLHPALRLPRRPAPVPLRRGSVAIADGRAGVYPSAGPGGWWVLGTTPTELFDPWRSEPTALLPGDEVRFEVAEPGATTTGWPRLAGAGAHRRSARSGTHEAAITAIEVWPGGASLQGRPRSGVGHLGMSQAGALDGRAFVAAAKLAGAPLDAPALELMVPHATLRAERPLLAAWAGGGARLRLEGRDVPSGRPFRWPAGTLLEVRPAPLASGAIAVLAVGGGLAPLDGPVGHPSLIGAGSTDARAAVGGFGRALVAGDVLALAGPPRTPDPTWAGRVRHASRVGLRLHRGPHGESAAYAALLATTYRLAARDRMGARLDGPAVRPERPDVASEGVPLGAVQLPADGRPIVLLADRGRTGGYAIVGIVDPRDLPSLAQTRNGGEVVFEPPTR